MAALRCAKIIIIIIVVIIIITIISGFKGPSWSEMHE
jgi:Na+/proline symporter